MHAVGPHVHVVPIVQAAFGEGPLVGLPLGRQPGDHRRRQASGRAEEPGQRRREVTRGHAVQVHRRQHLGHLRRAAGPRREDRGPEPAPLPGIVDTLVVHPRCGHLDRSRRSADRARLGPTVAHHQAMAALIALAGQPGDVGVHFHLEGSRQHPAGTIQDDLIERRDHLCPGVVIGHYCQHRRSFLTGAPTPAELVLVQRGRYVAPLNESPIHRFRSYL